MKNGVVAEMTLNTRTAADERHPAFVTSAALPASHPALPEGTLLVEGTEAGSVALAAASGTQTIFGVLQEAVEPNAGVCNVMIHGSCPADILVTVASNGDKTPASAALIKSLRGIGIYV